MQNLTELEKAIELLPCPFCGCKNVSIESNGVGDFYAICGDGEEGCSSRTSDYRCESEKRAIERWNTRHDERENNQLRADLKQCAEALTDIGYNYNAIYAQKLARKALSLPSVKSALKDQTK